MNSLSKIFGASTILGQRLICLVRGAAAKHHGDLPVFVETFAVLDLPSRGVSPL